MGLARREERALVRAARAGSEEAAERLFREIWPLVLRCAQGRAAYPEQVEEIVQEAMGAIFLGLDGFDLRRRLAPWCWRITANTAARYKKIDAVAKKKGARLAEAPLPRDGPEAELAAVEDHVALEQALARLDTEHREILELVAAGMSARKIAALTGQSKSTVHRRRTEALDALRQELGT